MDSSLKTQYEESLKVFSASTSTFKLIASIPSSPSPDVKTLYVVDSSFNPPSLAHATLAQKAIQHDKGSSPRRLCLLLATQNADKAPKPASFEHRLAMVTIMARSLHKDLNVGVDVAVTKKPYFMDKAASIDDSGVYGEAQQVHCTGYDTIIRIFDSKYYPEDQKLSVLEPFLARHRLRVCYRVGDDVEGGGDRNEQDRYVEAIGDGSRENEGMKKEWQDMINLVDDADDVKGVSSTKARKAAANRNKDELLALLDENVAGYILDNGLYQDESTQS